MAGPPRTATTADGTAVEKKPRPLPGRWVDAWCRESDLPSGVRCVLYALGNYMDKRGVCWPSLTTLARDTALDRRHVYRLLATAEEAGWIERQKSAGPKGNGGRSTLYRFAIAEGRDTDAPTPEGRDIEGEGRDIHDTKVGAPMSPEGGLERPDTTTSKKELCDSQKTRTAPLSVNKWEASLSGGDLQGLAQATLDGLTIEEGRWLLQGLDRAETEGVATAELYASELAAIALHDMQREFPHRWSRNRFVGFITSAARVRTDMTGGGSNYDTDLEDAIKRAWAI